MLVKNEQINRRSFRERGVISPFVFFFIKRFIKHLSIHKNPNEGRRKVLDTYAQIYGVGRPRETISF